MSVEETNVIDFASLNKSRTELKLTISDHLTWSEEPDDHLLVLQSKLNAYIHFIESKQVYEMYPDSEGRNLIIELACKYQPTNCATNFLDSVKSVLSGISV